MTKYIKFDAYGKFAEEAPKSAVKDGKLILGYNKESNEDMLLADGYLPYNGSAALDTLALINDEITEPLPEDDPIMQTVFTKLQIRRAFRKLGVEDELDAILSSNYEVQKDWNDAQVINLDDEVFKTALSANYVNEEFLKTIIDNIEEQ